MQLRERYHDMAIAAQMTSTLVENDQFTEMTPILDQIKDSFEAYAWIGFASPSGHVWASTGSFLVGSSVESRPWFQAALKGPYLGDVHEAVLLENLLNPEGGEPLRFIDVAVPILTTRGELMGVLGAHLNLTWFEQLGHSLLQPLQQRIEADLLIVGEGGELIMGPSGLESPAISDTLTNLMKQQPSGYTTEETPDGQRSLVGFSKLRDDDQYKSLNWTLLIRQPVDSAFAGVTNLRNTIIVTGVVSALLFCLLAGFVAHRIARPLLKVAREAEGLSEGSWQNPITLRNDFEEVHLLTQALRRLVNGLRNNEAELTALNASLEKRVEARTSELESVNTVLRSEMKQREQLFQEREDLMRQLEHSANTDALTGISNRRHFFEAGGLTLKRAIRHERHLSAMMIDVDHFKIINDTYGHAFGDQVLQHLVRLAQTILRDTDIPARLGGEEFVVLLEEADEGQSTAVAERLRKLVESEPLNTGGLSIHITISIGIASLDGCQVTDELDVLIARADKALYAAKNGGRNRVVQISGCGT